MANFINTLLPQSQFVRNVFTLVSATTLTQMLAILLSPVFSRLYTPDEFALLAVFTSLAMIFGAVITGQYHLTIMLQDNDEDSLNMAMLSIIITVILSLIYLVIIALGASTIAGLVGNPQIEKWLYLIPLMTLFFGFFQTLNYWHNRRQMYRIMSLATVSRGLTESGTKLGLGVLEAGATGLILSTVLGQLIGTVYLGRQIIDKIDRSVINRVRICELARTYLAYPTKSAIGVFFNTVSYRFEIILFSIFFSPVELGLYFFTAGKVTILQQFIGPAFWQIFTAETSGQTKPKIRKFMHYYQDKLLVVTTMLFYSTLFVIPELFVFVFGPNWRGAVGFILPLTIAVHMNLIVSSFSLFLVLNLPHAERNFNILLAAAKIFAVLIGNYLFHNIIYAVYMLAAAQFGLFFILGIWYYRQLGAASYFFVKLVAKHFGMIFPFILPIALARYFLESYRLLFAVYLIANIIFYALHYRKIKN